MTLRRTTRSLLRPATFSRAGAVAVAAAVAASLAACGGGSGGGGTTGSSSTNKLTIAANSDSAPTGYDPGLYSQGQFTFFSTLYDALFVTDKDGKIQPSLVTDFSTSKDNLKLTLRLRDGVTFTDGSKLDAALVKQNLDQRTNDDLQIHGTLGEGGSAEIKSVAASDPTTVVITWAKPQAAGQNNLTDEAGAIVGAKAATDRSSLKTTPDGSGPYTLDTGKTTRGSTYTVTKKKDAWNAAAFPYETIAFKIITDPQALANAVVSGQADVAGQLDQKTIDLVKSRKSVVSVGGTVVGFPVADKTGKTNAAFAKQEVRQALSYAIDRDTIVKQLHPGSLATAQLFPKAATGYDRALNQEFAYNPDKAKQLLAQAGYPNGFKIDLTVLGQPTEDEVAVQGQWKKVGVTVNFVTATSTDAAFAAAATQPLLFGPFAVGQQPAGFVAGVLYGGFMNLQHAKDPAIEKALGASLGSTGAQQEAALRDLNRAITENGWYLPIYEDYIYTGYDKAKVVEPKYAGTNGYLVLSEIKPAS